MEQPKKQHGGYRPGSGRKPNAIPKKTFSVKLTEEEKAKVIEFIKKMRENYEK